MLSLRLFDLSDGGFITFDFLSMDVLEPYSACVPFQVG